MPESWNYCKQQITSDEKFFFKKNLSFIHKLLHERIVKQIDFLIKVNQKSSESLMSLIEKVDFIGDKVKSLEETMGINIEFIKVRILSLIIMKFLLNF